MDVKLLIFSLLVFALANAEYKSYKGTKLYKLKPKTEHDVDIIKRMRYKYAFWTETIQVNSDVRIQVTSEQQKEFEEYAKSALDNFEVICDDVQKLIDDTLRKPPLTRFENIYDWRYYQTLDQINDWLRAIQLDYADVAELVVLGGSYYGRHTYGIKIDYKKQANPTTGMLEGGIHAREWISPATLTWIINEFLTSTDPEVRALAENIVWHIFPVVNPDGYDYTFTTDRMWRKNMNSAMYTSCEELNMTDDKSIGVDLNRNFGFMWMTTTGVSSDPCSEMYAGPTANSEPETIAIINYVNGLKQQGHLLYYIAFHSYSQMLLVPYSHISGSNVSQAPNNYGDLYEIGIKGMDKLKQRYGTEYKVGTAKDILYEVSGASFDWARGVADVPISFLFELRDVGQYGFLLPPEQIIENSQEVMDGLLEMDRVTRQMGYYTRGAAQKFSISIIAILTSVFVALNAL